MHTIDWYDDGDGRYTLLVRFDATFAQYTGLKDIITELFAAECSEGKEREPGSPYTFQGQVEPREPPLDDDEGRLGFRK